MHTGTTSELLTASMMQQREQREMKAMGKATEVAKKAYDGQPV